MHPHGKSLPVKQTMLLDHNEDKKKCTSDIKSKNTKNIKYCPSLTPTKSCPRLDCASVEYLWEDIGFQLCLPVCKETVGTAGSGHTVARSIPPKSVLLTLAEHSSAPHYDLVSLFAWQAATVWMHPKMCQNKRVSHRMPCSHHGWASWHFLLCLVSLMPCTKGWDSMHLPH